jgi:hypothetical protein
MVMDLRTFGTMECSFGSIAKVAVVAALAGSLAGCFPREQFPVEPRITDPVLRQFGDSASLVVSFTDGDGDIGLGPSDNQPPFDTASTYFYNLFLEYEELRNGEWVRPPLAIPFYYRIPRITPTGQNKALEGELAVALKPWPIIPGNPFDTIRFSVLLVDRALHLSNVEYTEPVKVP